MTSDYQRGVEDATKPLTGAVVKRISGYQFAGVPLIDMLNETLEDRRKSLLTKKVTKWVNVYSDGTKVSAAHSTFDTEQAAKEGATPGGVLTELFGSYIGTYQKTIPFEIEVPID